MKRIILSLFLAFTSSLLFSQDLQIPKQFLPDGDGFLDNFVISTNGVPFSYKVYTRTGEEIYSSATGQPWDGKHKGLSCPNGVYIVVVEVYYSTGTVIKKQTVDLLR